MSLSARVEITSSLRVAQAGMVFPLVGLVVASSTLVSRWQAHGAVVLATAGIVLVLMTGFGLRRLRRAQRCVGLALSDRIDIDAWSSSRPDFDGPARLVEATVVWPDFWMLALRPTSDTRVEYLPILPCDLEAATRRSLARYLAWADRGRGGRAGRREIAVR